MYIKKKRINFSKIEKKIIYPDFLKHQIKSFNKFLNINCIKKKKLGLYKSFKENFPIKYKKKNFSLDFLNFYIEPPKISINNCIKQGKTYNVYIKVKLKLKYKYKKKKKIIINKFNLCSCPYMTPSGSFIFNGSERVVVFQLNRSYGVYFGNIKHYNNKYYYAKVIPLKGVWIEFIIENNNILYTYINKKKKIPITIFLRSIGYYKMEDLMLIFNIVKKIKIKNNNINKIIGKVNVFKIKKKKKIIINKNEILNKKNIKKLIKYNIKYFYIYNKNINDIEFTIFNNTLKKDQTTNYKESILFFYKVLKNSYPPSEKKAKSIIKNIFFSNKQYYLGKVGRYKINQKLNINISYDLMYLTKIDIIKIIKKLINISNYKKETDDIDNLSNRQVKTIGDQLYKLFNLGLLRISRLIKEKINIKDNKKFTLMNLINTKILSSIINSFFGTSQLSQFMDKTNPLSEITHKRRVTLLGPGGIVKTRATFEARDVNISHYGRLCPIETPEGPNIGLISSLCLFAKINNMGFIETPYKKIINGKESKKNYFLTPDKERNKIISQCNINFLFKKKIIVRKYNSFPFVYPNKIDYKDYSPNQIVSISAGLIPFLEHNDANRSLMGSNMMRQAVPLLTLDPPIVGTGLEKKIIFYSRNFINAKSDGVIKYVDSKKIIVKYNFSKEKKNTNFYNKYYTHRLKKFKKTNQNTCFNLSPIVKKGEKITKNQILCDGFSNKNGELALGKNLLVAFMPWKGYNFEDAILVSNKVLREDYFTSIHIDEYTLDISNTKFGEEEFTKDLPNVSNKSTKNIDKNGIIKIGTKVKPGDILIGKIVPKGNNKNTPEEKFLKSIFGDKASNVKDASLRAHASLYGIVINTKIFYKYKKFNKKNKYYKKYIKNLEFKYKIIRKKIYKIFIKKIIKIIKIKYLLKNIILNKKILYKKKYIINSKIIKYLLFKNYNLYKYIKINNKEKFLIKKLINKYNIYVKIIKNKYKKKKIKILVGHELPYGLIKIAKVYIAKKRKLKIGDKMSGRHGNKGVISKILRDEDMPYLEDGTIVDIVFNPLSVPSRMNIGLVLESILGYIGLKMNKNFSIPVFDGLTIKDIYKLSKKVNIKNLCETTLYDGQSGEKFDNKITIGVIYMFKLGHMVDDKMHARSIGPYSLITQQPLGGKSQFGGQRFGEMEVWALEAFGVSNILREILTVKSDDIKGRSKIYEAIVKGKKFPNINLPESFKVLINELKGLCINLLLED
ncbi:MAG: DNA-directed RNA polymerase subunit beta [Candidatus Shikimatogenerans bostrichidophilus]|nr:MAG: DNA-directed RNA polymerase subunit beta [Candidatus Shikimatogenerans bostrichidophilus]